MEHAPVEDTEAFKVGDMVRVKRSHLLKMNPEIDSGSWLLEVGKVEYVHSWTIKVRWNNGTVCAPSRYILENLSRKT